MWLLETKYGKEIKQAIKDRVEPSVLEREAFLTATANVGCSECRILSIAGSSAEISVKGILTKTRSFLAWYIGGGNTTYSEIVAALAEADKDPNVKDATVNIDSPGGNFDGLFEALAAIQAFSKPITAKVTNLAASAAYAIASQCNSIVVSNRAARVGSIGVVATFYVYDDEIEITSTQAPKKRPDVTTDEGKAMVREELDAMHDLFVDSIAKGRGKTVETINAEFGQGATLLADNALKRGMIDAIATGDSGQASKSATYTDSIGAQSVLDLVEAKLGKPEHRPAASARQETSVMDLIETALGITNSEVMEPDPAPSADLVDAAPAPRQTEPEPAPKTQVDVAKNLLKTAFGIDPGTKPDDTVSRDVLSIIEKELGIVALLD